MNAAHTSFCHPTGRTKCHLTTGLANIMDYTTLGTGNKTQILFTDSGHPARAIASLPHTNAEECARALQRAYTDMPSALFAPAVEQAGAPVEARRILLNMFDACASNSPVTSQGPAWRIAEQLIARVGRGVAGCSPATIASIRKEIAEQALPAAYDGILVPARISSEDAGEITLVISDFLNVVFAENESDARNTLENLSTQREAHDPTYGNTTEFPFGQPVVAGIDDAHAVDTYWDASPYYDTSFSQTPVHSIVNDSPSRAPTMDFRVSDFQAWIAHNCPTLTNTATRALHP